MVLLFLPKVTQICGLPITPSVGGHLRQICNPCVWICSPLGALDKHLCGPRPASQWKQILGKTYISVVLYMHHNENKALGVQDIHHFSSLSNQSLHQLEHNYGKFATHVCERAVDWDVYFCSPPPASQCKQKTGCTGCTFLRSSTCITMKTKDWVDRKYISAVLYLHHKENKRQVRHTFLWYSTCITMKTG